MIRTIRQLLLPAAIVALALIAPAQAAANPLAVLRDCADSDVFEKKHSRADLRAALGQIQADLGEYGTCGRMIQKELAELKRTAKAQASGNAPVDLDGDGVISEQEREISRQIADRGDRKPGGGGDGGGSNGSAGGSSQGNGLTADGGEDGDDSSSGTVATSGGGGGGGSSLALILAVAALACGAVGGGLWYAGKRNPAIGNALRRVPIPFRNS